MAVKIRLTRLGRHKRPFYRIVVADSNSPRDGKFIDILGTYDPLATPAATKVQEEKAIGWLKQGAEVSETVKSIFAKAQLFKKAKEANAK
ncbi:MAG TPA: 30S ribosomal protein S16 [Candidatus Manganitrophaceae bacterium]|nr:30S ribosomal protein S16 [Candidatus Manganitrophaceae bacterium]